MKLTLLILVAVALVVDAVPKSRFVKDIDADAIEKEWADEESADWHEDSYEWKRKNKKQGPPLDIEEISRQAKAGVNPKEAMLAREAASKEMQMAFGTLKPGAAASKEAAEKIASRWRDLMATDGIQVQVYAIADNEVLFTEDAGRILDVREFVLAQPEALKFRWKDTDFLAADAQKLKAERAAKAAPPPAKAKKPVAPTKAKAATGGSSSSKRKSDEL